MCLPNFFIYIIYKMIDRVHQVIWMEYGDVTIFEKLKRGTRFVDSSFTYT
jgi:hypothetical protein